MNKIERWIEQNITLNNKVEMVSVNSSDENSFENQIRQMLSSNDYCHIVKKIDRISINTMSKLVTKFKLNKERLNRISYLKTVIKFLELNDGFYLYKLQNKEDFIFEAKELNNCLISYYAEMSTWDHPNDIYVLKNANHKSLIAIEFDSDHKKIRQMKAKSNHKPPVKYVNYLALFISKLKEFYGDDILEEPNIPRFEHRELYRVHRNWNAVISGNMGSGESVLGNALHAIGYSSDITYPGTLFVGGFGSGKSSVARQIEFTPIPVWERKILELFESQMIYSQLQDSIILIEKNKIGLLFAEKTGKIKSLF